MKKLVLILVTAVLLMGMMFAAATESTEKVSDLSAWKGLNVSTTKILSGTRMNAYASAIAEHKDGYNAQMVKIFVNKMYYSTFFSWEVLEDARTVVFDNMYTGEYDYVGAFMTKWGEYDLTWQIFKTESPQRGA